MLRALALCLLVGCGVQTDEVCLLPPSLDMVRASVPDAYYTTEDGVTPNRYYMFAKLDYAAAPDTLVIDLRGEVDDQSEIALAGVESSYETCHACVLVFTDFDVDSGPVGDPYMPVFGTLRLNTVSPDLVSGSLVDVELQHVTIDAQGTTVRHSDGCSATLERLAFASVPELVEE